jgi:hypothetical protein
MGSGAGAMKKTFTRKALLLSLFLFAILMAKASAQTPGDAVDALKQLQQKCESGISYQDYGPALEQVKIPVRQFLAGPGSRSSPGFSVPLEKALMHYENAGKVMLFRKGSSDYFLSSQDPALFDVLKKTYPELKVLEQKGKSAFSFDEAVQLMWTRAASEIEQASDNIPSGEEKTTGSIRTGGGEGTDTAKLWKQISDLKMQNRRLKKENKELRRELDRRKSKTTP